MKKIFVVREHHFYHPVSYLDKICEDRETAELIVARQEENRPNFNKKEGNYLAIYEALMIEMSDL